MPADVLALLIFVAAIFGTCVIDVFMPVAEDGVYRADELDEVDQ